MPVFRARHLATMLGPVIDDGCVIARDGRIIEAGPTHIIRPPSVDVEIDGVLMPGLINAHAHLELTNVSRPSGPVSFVDWVLTTMASQRRDHFADYQRDRAAAVRQGVAQCVRFGVTCVGDISQNVELIRPVLAKGPIRSVSFGECLGIGERRERFDALLAKAKCFTGPAGQDHGDFMRIGISPHSPYTIDPAGYAKAVEADSDPVTIHLAETPDESVFMQSHQGPLARLYEALGLDPGEPTWPNSGLGGGVIEAVCGLAREIPLLVHVNYCNDADLNYLAGCHSPAIVWCPRTHRYFGHSPHRWKEMIERDIVLCVGTDSCASSPDLNLVDDLRLLHADEPSVPVETLWALVTRDADRALRWGYDGAINMWDGGIDSLQTPRPLGTMAPGAMADFVAFATAGGDPLREILETPTLLPAGVWVGGEMVRAE